MADVNVTVMIDGKPAYSAGAVGTPDATGFALTALDHARAHFTAVKLGLPMDGPSMRMQQAQTELKAAQAKQDNSL